MKLAVKSLLLLFWCASSALSQVGENTLPVVSGISDSDYVRTIVGGASSRSPASAIRQILSSQITNASAVGRNWLTTSSPGGSVFPMVTGDSVIYLDAAAFLAAIGGDSDGGGTPITIREIDGSPTMTLTTLEVTNDTLTNMGSGVARLAIGTGSGGGGVWGSITGTLSAQTDLQTALNNKLGPSDSGASLTGLTFPQLGGTASDAQIPSTITRDAEAAAAYQPLNSSLTQIAGLGDPNADRMVFWDDSAGAFVYLTPGTNLSITGTTLNATAGGGGGTWGTITGTLSDQSDLQAALDGKQPLDSDLTNLASSGSTGTGAFSRSSGATINDSRRTVHALGNLTGTSALNFTTSGSWKTATATGNVTFSSVTLSAASIGIMSFTQDATGGRTITWPASVVDPEPTIDSTPNATTLLTFSSSDGTNIYVSGAVTANAPATADYLVGTANVGLSNEIPVGLTPQGELGGTWALPTIDDGVTVDSWTLTNATFTSPSFTNATLTTPIIADLGYIKDANGNEILVFDSVTSAINHFGISNSIAGSNPTLYGLGDDANVGIAFQGKGGGVFQFLGTTAGPATLRLYEDIDNSSEYVAIAAPSSLASSVTLTLGTTAGTLAVQSEVNGTLTGTHASPSTTTPLSPTWTGPMHSVWYGVTGTINLPAASGYAGRGILIYNTGAFTVTVDANASEVIVRDGTVQTGGVSMTLSSGAGNYVALLSDGVRWITLGFKGTLAAGS